MVITCIKNILYASALISDISGFSLTAVFPLPPLDHCLFSMMTRIRLEHRDA